MSTEANKDVSTEAALTAAPEITTSQISQTMMGLAIVWFVGACALGISDVLLVYSRILFLFVVIPVIIFGTVFAFSPRLRAWAFALDSRLIILLNMLRVGGLAFLMLYADGRLNGAFALPAGWMDFIVAFTAPLAAFYLTPTRTTLRRLLLLAWIVFGIADFAIAIPLGVVARSQNPTSMIATNQFPQVIIPTFGVPLVVIGYFILLAQLWRQRRQA